MSSSALSLLGAQARFGPFLFFDMRNINGHFLLDLADSAGSQFMRMLLDLAHAESRARKRQLRPTTAQAIPTNRAVTLPVLLRAFSSGALSQCGAHNLACLGIAG